jgi:hypothetical protein
MGAPVFLFCLGFGAQNPILVTAVDKNYLLSSSGQQVFKSAA